MCCWFRVVTISPFRVLNKVSVWVVKVEEEAVYRIQSIGTTISPPPPPSFAMFLSLKATLILYAKGMNQDYKIRSLGWKRVGKRTMCPTTQTRFQCKPREVISNFNSLLPLVVTAKSVRFMVSEKYFCQPQHKFLTVIVNCK